MASVNCQYCGKAISSVLIKFHENNCPNKTQVQVQEPQVEMTPAPVPAAWSQPEEPTAETPNEALQRAVREVFGEHEVQVDPQATNGLYVPEVDINFAMQTDLIADLERIEKQSQEHPVNVLLIGKQGAGKSSIAEQFAAHYKRPCYVVPCVTMQEQAQWWGLQQVSQERGTFYIPSEFVKAVETPRCVVILDDMNRVENPKVLNPLFGVLDYHRQTYLDDMQRYVKVAEGVVFFGTVNEGWAFQGTDPIDAALRDRFDQIFIPYPPRNKIADILAGKTRISWEDARMVAEFASDLDSHPTTKISISMRVLLRIAEHMTFGASLQEAIKFCMQASLEPKEVENMLAILQTKLQDKYTATESAWVEWK